LKPWKKTALGTTIVLVLLLIGVFYLFNWKIAKTSPADIEFSPQAESQTLQLDSIPSKPKNIIFFIADGMGFSHLSLAMMSQKETGATSVWQQFDVRAWHDTRSTYGPITDSGASATAMATGTPTFFDVIGMDADGNSVPNVFEVATSNGYNTGIVTDSYVWDATPAAFLAHTKSRDNARDILVQTAASEVDILFGELEDLGQDGNPELEETMEILTKRFQILDKSLVLPDKKYPLQPIAAIYEEDEIQDLESQPNLPKLTTLALTYLTKEDAPFALMVECEEMDSGSHSNNSKRVLKGIEVIEETLSLILDFAEKDGNTLVVFTADHETGGMAAGVDFDEYPNMQIIWASQDHTASVVPLLAKGPGSEEFINVDRNWQIGQLLEKLIITKDSIE
jgi:alkaline phosphatase